MCSHTWVLKENSMQSFHAVAHDLHFRGTSVSLSKTLLGISMQCWWYQVLHASHSAILSPFSSDKRQEQWRSTDWVCLIPTVLHSPTIGNRERLHFSKQSAKCRLWSYLILHRLLPLQMLYANAMARTPQSELFDYLPTSIILTMSCSGGLNTRLAINFIVPLECMLLYTLTTPSSHPMLETVHQWQPPTKMICTNSPLRLDLAGRLCVGIPAIWATEQP